MNERSSRTAPIVVGDHVLVGDVDGSLVAIDLGAATSSGATTATAPRSGRSPSPAIESSRFARGAERGPRSRSTTTPAWRSSARSRPRRLNLGQLLGALRRRRAVRRWRRPARPGPRRPRGPGVPDDEDPTRRRPRRRPTRDTRKTRTRRVTEQEQDERPRADQGVPAATGPIGIGRRARAPRRRGLLDSILAPRVPGSTPMPRIRTSLARGCRDRGLVVPLVARLIGCCVAVDVARRSSPSATRGRSRCSSNALACHRSGRASTLTLSIARSASPRRLPGDRSGSSGVARHRRRRSRRAMLVDVLQTGRPRPVVRWSARCGSLPVTLGRERGRRRPAHARELSSGRCSGPGFGAADPARGARRPACTCSGSRRSIAADEGRGIAESLGRSVRAARLPGAGNLMFAALYVVSVDRRAGRPRQARQPGSGVNPSIAAWVFVLVVNLCTW